MIYLYDGTFDGLLTCIYHHYYEEKVEGIYAQSNYQQTLLNNYKFIKTDKIKASKVYNAINQKISNDALVYIQYVFLSNDYKKDTYILKYVVLGFKRGGKLDDYHSHPNVLPIHQLYRKVSFEAHRFLGLVRFIDVQGVLYSEIEPDNDIIIILVQHFSDRLKNEKFIIHDKKRKKAVIYNNDNWYETDFNIKNNIPISQNEALYQELWQGYFEHIAIESRKNLSLQQHFVPKKYRKNLTEFKL